MAHVLESDGVSTHLFHTLSKDNRRMETARVFLPPTVIFEHGFASAWYSCSSDMRVKRHVGKSITMNEVFEIMTNNLPEGQDIVASFIEAHVPRSMADVPQVISRFMTANELRDFLFSAGQRPRGILQRFEMPKGWSNTGITATWSPTMTIAEAVRNPYSINDRTKTASERGGTFENKLSTQVAMTTSVSAAVKRLCELVAVHVHQVEHVQVQAMVLHLKVTKANRVTLLYSSSFRVATQSSFGAADMRPLNMHQRFISKEEHTRACELERHLSLYAAKKPIPKHLPPLSEFVKRRADVDECPYAAKLRKAMQSIAIDDSAVPSVVHVGGKWVPARGPVRPTPLPLDSKALEAEPAADAAASPETADSPGGGGLLESPSGGGLGVSVKTPIKSPRRKSLRSSMSANSGVMSTSSGGFGRAPLEDSSDEDPEMVELRDLVGDIVYDVECAVTERGATDFVYRLIVAAPLNEVVNITMLKSVMASFNPEEYVIEAGFVDKHEGVWPRDADRNASDTVALLLKGDGPIEMRRQLAQMKVKFQRELGEKKHRVRVDAILADTDPDSDSASTVADGDV